MKLLVNEHPIPQPVAVTTALGPGVAGEDDAACRAWAATVNSADAAPRLVAMIRARAAAEERVSVTVTYVSLSVSSAMMNLNVP